VFSDGLGDGFQRRNQVLLPVLRRVHQAAVEAVGPVQRQGYLRRKRRFFTGVDHQP
jgi:hypothetical protein